ncbi:MAG: hypothetical protein AAFY57_09125 [Cyanobacteria bacterium J06642_2]
MNEKALLPNILQYAIAAFLSWLLISGQVSDSAFLWLFLIYGLVNYAVRRRGEKSKEEN